MKKIIKWSGVAVAVLVLISLIHSTSGKKRPDVSADDLLRAGLQEIRVHKNYPKAITLLRRTLAIAPTYTDAKVGLGHAYLLTGNMDSAQKYLQTALNADSKNQDAMLYLVNANMQQHDTVAVLRNIDRYMEHYPADNKLLLKKYILLLQHREYAQADEVSKDLDSRGLANEVKTINYDYWLAAATSERKAGNYQKAYDNYKKALPYRSREPEVLQQLVNLGIYLGYYTDALAYNKTLIEEDQKNSAYLINASVIYANLHENELAETYAEQAYRLSPGDGVSKSHFIDLNLSFAKNAGAADRLRYANMILHVAPTQKEALLYAINSHIVLHENSKALEATNIALQYYPSDKVFINKKLGILHDMNNYTQTADYLNTLVTRYPAGNYTSTYQEVWLQIAVDLIKEQQWSGALAAIEKGLVPDKNNKALLEQQVNVYGSAGETDKAMAVVDKLIVLEPGNAAYKFKKAGLLEQQGKFDEAATITYALMTAFPATTVYKTAYQDELESAANQQMKQMNWSKVVAIYNKSIAAGRPARTTLLYGIGAYAAMQRFDSALAATGTALGFYPGDSLFRVKRSQTFMELRRYPDGLAVSRELISQYPADKALQRMYVDELQTAGIYYVRNHSDDMAIDMFVRSYAVEPDTFALQNLSAIYFVRKQYDSAIYYADLGLKYDNNNAFLLMKKASAYEALKNYKMAYASANQLLKHEYSKPLSDYSQFLQGKASRNQVGVSHLQSIFSGSDQYASITGIDYMRRFKRGSVTARVQVGERPTGTGAQGGFDAFYSHTPTFYSNAYLYGAVGAAFPFWQGGYSAFKTFHKSWEAEAGAKYLGLDSINNYTAVASVGKYLRSTWINVRGFYTYNKKGWYPSAQLTTRQYLNDKSDYVAVMAGYGRIPDEHSQVYNFDQYNGYGSKNIGLGFQKGFRYGIGLNATVNYTELKITEGKTLNEYDIYVRLSKNF